MYGYNQPYGFQNNPYLNNQYGYQNQYQQMMPQQIQQNNQEVLQGTIVDSIDVVKAKNCDLNGNPQYFPKSDKTEIYCKQLNPINGSANILTYKLVTDDVVQPKELDNNQLAQMISKLQVDMEEMKTIVLDTITAPSKGGDSK